MKKNILNVTGAKPLSKSKQRNERKGDGKGKSVDIGERGSYKTDSKGQNGMYT